MSSQAKRKHDKKKRLERRSSEDRRGDAVTVAWMLCTMATAAALLIAGLAFVFAPPAPAASDNTASGPNLLASLLPLMLFTSAVTGLILLCLTPLVYLFRRVPPPRLITVVAVIVGLLPLVALAALAMTST